MYELRTLLYTSSSRSIIINQENAAAAHFHSCYYNIYHPSLLDYYMYEAMSISPELKIISPALLKKDARIESNNK